MCTIRVLYSGWFLAIGLLMCCRGLFAQTNNLIFTGKLNITKPYSSLNNNEQYLSDSTYYETVRKQKQFECTTLLLFVVLVFLL